MFQPFFQSFKKIPFSHKGSIAALIFFSLIGYTALVFASPNIPGGPLAGSGGFTAGTELDPDCAPNQVAPEPCIVKVPPGESTTANNGLTLTGTNVQLGGALVKDTNIVQGSHTLASTFDGTNGSYGFVNGNYGPMQTVGMLYIPTATPYIITAASVGETGANLATRNYITTEQSAVSAYIDSGTGEHRASLSARATDASNMYAFTSFGQQGKAIMSEYSEADDFAYKMFQIDSNNILQQLSYSRIDNQNYLYNQAVMDDTSLDFSIGNSVVAGVFSGSGKEYKLSNTGHEFNGLDLFANQYPSTRDDSGSFSPVNFLYTDSSGKILSAPMSLLSGGGSSGWSLTGNAGTTLGTNFIGTTDVQDFMVKTNGNQIALFGQNGNVAIGQGSLGFGLGVPQALASNSFAVGPGAIASNIPGGFDLGTYAIGALASSTNSGSVALGTFANASGIGAIAIGPSISSSQYSVAIGQGANASNADSIAIGRGSVASGSESFALGISSSGDQSQALGTESFAIGYGVTAYASQETSMGIFNTPYVTSPAMFSLTSRLFNIGNGTGFGSESDAFTILKNGKTGIGYDNFETTAFDSLLQVNGSILSANLHSTQDDSGVFAPVNFLYTDADGKILSAPRSLLSLKWYAENVTEPWTAPVATGTGSIALGDEAKALASNMFVYGNQAGYNATDANDSNFFGGNAGSGATYASGANFFGLNAGYNATDANDSNFFGVHAGYNATNANNSNFFGGNAGSGATYAYQSNFFGLSAGRNATNATNSIFIGPRAGDGDNVNNTGNSYDYSILIGQNTLTGGFSNSIALGGGAINTASNQLMIGSTTRAINTVRIQGSSIGTQCTITTGTGIACTSDERLKTNITDISGDALARLANVRTVHYNLIGDTSHRNQIGFLAQNLEQYFPELVDTNADGYKSVYYAQMTPILVEAVKELDIKLADIQKVADATDQTFAANMKNWFASAANGITLIVSDTLQARNKICIDDVCMTKDQLREILQKNASSEIVPVVPNTSTSSQVLPESSLGDNLSQDSSVPETPPNTVSTGAQLQDESPVENNL